MEDTRSKQKSVPALLASIVWRSLRLGVRLLQLGVLMTIVHSGPLILPLLRRLALLGACLSVFLEFIARVPDFPFWSSMQLSILCTLPLLVHQMVKHLMSEK